MAYTKDLGKVKGEDGDIYLPDISIKGGKLHFKWVKTPAEEIQNRITEEKDLYIPVYVPGEMDANGNVTFSLTQTVMGTNNQPLPNDKTYHLQGPQGPMGNTSFHVVHVSENSVYDIPIGDRQADTIYVKDTKAWFYDADAEDFFMLEGIDLSNYYTKNQTYSSAELDEMFSEITRQAELAYMLLDIENIIL